ncbi:extracellular solute-binding protein [Pseudonocardia sp. ICBG601]|uniref:ABC transporter substrate-binding protein n=1 Tax=Pseudonocardia sp. ICBG601 TaxID=2846759 RepID=UPI001CF6FE1A|nr:extracellular solute-binding protein [Pseudonocardia sp. ICBG601]
MRRRLGAALVLVTALVLTACSPASRFDDDADGVTTVTLRLWDTQVAAAYRRSFDAFSAANPDIRVELVQVPFKDYFTSLPLDVASGTATDIYWVNSSNFGALADAGRLIDIGSALADQRAGWVPAAADQYSRGGTLWGVPAVTDGRIALFYNKDLVRAAGVDPTTLRWDPTDPARDTLLPAARRLTADATGRTADQPGFDPRTVRRYGFNAARDLQAIYVNFLASAGGRLQAPDETFDLATPAGEQAFGYLVNMIDTERVAPSAADTNQNPDFSRDQFLRGRIALFQSGTYNLANIAEGATFDWGIAPMVEGPRGRSAWCRASWPPATPTARGVRRSCGCCAGWDRRRVPPRSATAAPGCPR